MNIEDIFEIWYALNIAYSPEEARKIFVKLIKNLKEIIF